MRAGRLLPLAVVALLACPSAAAAQKDQFFEALLSLYQALAGVYGNEGAELTTRLDTLSAALERWDRATIEAEQQLRKEEKGADPQTALRVHTLLASMYIERRRFNDALEEFNQDIRIDPKRAVFHRFKALVYQAGGRRSAAADAFRAAWLLDPADLLNAYYLIVQRSAATTDADIQQALATLATAERELVKGGRAPANAPFISLHPVNDDVGGSMAFVPAAYARAFSLLLAGDFTGGMTVLRAAVAADPLNADPAARSDPMVRGIAALRQGEVDQAIALLEMAQAASPDSSEVHRVLGTAYGVAGNTLKSLQHLRDAVRLNPRDERSWLAIARTLDAQGDIETAVGIVRGAVKELPDAGALRWLQSLLSARRQQTQQTELELVSVAERLVLIAGQGELYGRVARLAQAHLEYDRAIALLEQRVVITPNNPAAHHDLGRAYEEQGRENEAYAEFVVALLLDHTDAETAAAIGRMHLERGRYGPAIDALTRATALNAANAAAVRALGDALVRAGQIAQGLVYLGEAERLQARAFDEQRRQRTAAMQMVQAEVFTSAGQYDEAVAAWQQVVELQGANESNLLRLANALLAAKRPERAADELLRAIALMAGPEAHRRLAEVLATLGRKEESARESRAYTEQRLKELMQRSIDATVTQ